MKLTVLGGSAAGPNPGQGCSGYLVDAGASQLVLDLGPGTLPELRRQADYRRLEAVVVSHLHLDHVLDLLALRFLLAYNPVLRPDRLPLWVPPDGIAFLERAAAAFAQPGTASEFFPSVFAVREYDPSSGLTIGDARVTFCPTVHYVPCWAMKVEEVGSGRSLLYTADTGPAADLAHFGEGAQVLVAEATLLEPGDESFAERGHLTAGEAGDLATAIGVETLVLTHLWHELGRERYQAAAADHYAGRLVVAEPGRTVEW